MKFYTAIPKSLKPYYDSEIEKYNLALESGNLNKAWSHLERAHIIGQRYPYNHSYAHWKMLQFGFKIKSGKEILGQIPRLIVGGVKSFVGKIPEGNPGGANVPPLKPFPIEQEIKEIFMKAGLSPS